MEPQIAYAKSHGLSVAYAVLGSGPPDLVVVPGFVSHLEVALEHPAIAGALARLASFARVITFDKPGTGLSDPVDGAPTLEERMDDLAAVLDAAGVERAALVGISEGALMSALFAATHPGRTQALVMYGCYAKGLAAADYPWAPTRKQVDLAVRMIQEDWGRGAFLDLYAPSASGDAGFARWWARYERLAASPAMAEAVVTLAAASDIRRVLPAISVPTLVLHRRDDALLPVEGARFVAGRIPGARLVELTGVDHFPYTGDTEAFLDEIEAFLTGTRHAPDLNRQLLTVLFTDIVGSTERAAELGDRRWRTLLEHHNDAVREQLRRFRGDEVKTIGDGFLAIFDGPARGVQCAQAISRDARGLGIEIRAGLHTGECEMQESDITGMAVNIGARVCALAGPGDVLVSSTVKDLVVGSALAFEPRGSHLLKGVPGAWTLFAATEP